MTRGEAIPLQWWEPTWLAAVYNLKRVQLDEAGQACERARATGVTTKKAFDCESEGIEILKFAWPGLKDKWPAAHRFLQADEMTNEHQGPMAMAVEGQNLTEVARQWVDENEAVWKPGVEHATQ